MVQALGYSQTLFDPGSPGRLCRGRERWIESCPLDERVELQRLVISGARFTDDSARDALRGLAYSGLGAGEVLDALFPGQALLAFGEQGEPGRAPPEAVLLEEHVQPRCGGRRMDRCLRWRAVAQGGAVDALVGEGPAAAEGFLPWGGVLAPALEDALFALCGQAVSSCMPRRSFQPTALVPLLQQVPWVALVHLDKHAPAIGLYSCQPLERVDALARLAEARGSLAVPFSIPPMLARWDRALFELRQDWGGQGEFPVPPGEQRIPSYHQREETEE